MSLLFTRRRGIDGRGWKRVEDELDIKGKNVVRDAS